MSTVESTAFGLMLRRPGAEADEESGYTPVCLAPDFTDLVEGWRAGTGSDPRASTQDWSLSLPHRCGEWNIGYGSREEVLADAVALRSELDQAIRALTEDGGS